VQNSEHANDANILPTVNIIRFTCNALCC